VRLARAGTRFRASPRTSSPGPGRTPGLAVVLAGLLTVVLGAGAAGAQTQDCTYAWSPSRRVAADGTVHTAAVAYEVWLKRGSAAPQLIATVTDTQFTLPAEPGVVQCLLVRALDADGRGSAMSRPSVPLYFESPEDLAALGDLPSRPRIPYNYPNPFNPATSIVYVVPNPMSCYDDVRLEVFDLQGRLVRRLGVIPAPGRYETSWDGTDDGGRLQPAGIYVTRLLVGPHVAANKMTLLK
jgi:hypothetical protein